MNLKKVLFGLFPLACFAVQQPARAMDGLLGMQLSSAREGTDFFRFFRLEPVGPVETNAQSSVHHFRPAAPAFHDLVRLDVETDSADRISGLKLQVDRTFIESPSAGVFAADLAKSFLLAAGGAAEREALRSLADEIQFRDLGRPLLIRRDAARELPPAPSPGYLAYCGRRAEWTTSTPAVSFALRNAEPAGRRILLLEADPVGKGD